MLTEENIARTALALSVCGITLLAMLSETIVPEETDISAIGKETEGKQVSVKGVVKWKTEKNKSIIFGLSDGKEIECIAYAPAKKEQEMIRVGRFLKARGTVKEGDGKQAIMVERLEEWK